jgi:ABC-type transport system involved in cytochrome c biogenesis permease component
MGRTARSVMSRLSPVFWLGAAVLAGLLVSDPDWSNETGRGVIAALILLTGAGISGVVSGAVEATHTGTIEMLIGALLEDRSTPGPRSRRYRDAA